MHPLAALGSLLPACARLTTRRTYSLNGARFPARHALAINCQACTSAQHWLTMPKLALSSRGIVPKWDQCHLPAEASLLPIKMRESWCPQHQNLSSRRSCGRDVPWDATKRETNQKGFKPVVGLHHPTAPHKGNSCLWAGLFRNAQIVLRTIFMGNNYCSNSPSLVPREFGFCGLSHLDRPTHMSRLPESIDIKNKAK